ncbi:MAG: hypothetical protein ACUZ8A_06435 [Candidatus Bathyanammoxibius sp.]
MDSKQIKQWLGTWKARFLLVVAVPVVLYLLGRLGSMWASDPVAYTSWVTDLGGHVLVGLLVLLLASFGVYVGGFALWVLIGAAWNLVTWVRTGKGNDYFDRDHPFDAGKRDDG